MGWVIPPGDQIIGLSANGLHKPRTLNINGYIYIYTYHLE